MEPNIDIKHNSYQNYLNGCTTALMALFIHTHKHTLACTTTYIHHLREFYYSRERERESINMDR